MRSRRLCHIAAIVCMFLYVIYRLSLIVRLFVVREEQDIITYPEVETGGSATIHRLTPKIIHQVYLGFDNKTMPAHWEVSRQKCVSLHPDYKYKLWSGDDVRNFLEAIYPWFLETFYGYKCNVQRADSIRYFILAEFGGVYIDLDDGCKQRLDPLLQFDSWMPGVATSAGLSNHVMASSPSHPYFSLLVNSIISYDMNYGTPYLTIMGSAGPHFVSFVWRCYLNIGATLAATEQYHHPRVRILMAGEASLMEDFFITVKGETWHTWDVRLFRWLSHHLPVVVVVVTTLIMLAVTMVWLSVWSTALLLGTGFSSLVRGNQALEYERLRAGVAKEKTEDAKVRVLRID